MSASHGPIRARISASILAAAIAAVFALLLGGLAPAPAGAAVGEFQPLAESETELTSMAVDPTTNLIYAQENQGRRFFAYDPRTDKWTELAEAPIDSGNNGGATYLNGKIYTVYTNNDEEMGVYDIAKDEWTVISNPLEQGTGNITAVGGELYLAVRKSFVKYNPATEVTTPLAEVPETADECEGFNPWGALEPYHGKIYGHTGDGCTGFVAYDIAADEWTELPQVPEGAVLGAAIDPVTGTYYAYGDYDGTNFYRYDIAKGEWLESLTLPFEEIDDGGMAYLSLPGLTGIYLIEGERGPKFSRFTTPEPEADLALTKTASTASTIVGGDITYTIKASNSGPAEAANATVSDPLPANVTFVSSATTQGSCSGTGTVTCSLGSLAAGASATVTVTVKAGAPGTATNTASVNSATADPNPGNNSASASTSVVSAVLNPAFWRVPGGKLTVRKGWVFDPLQNLNSGLTLSGTAELVSYGRGGGTKLASNTVYLGPGATKTLYLQLNSAARAKLRVKNEFNVQLVLNLHDESGRTVKATGVYLLVGPPVKHRHKTKHAKK